MYIVEDIAETQGTKGTIVVMWSRRHANIINK